MSTPANPYTPPKVQQVEAPGSPLESPTNVRFGVIGFTIAMSFLLYLDRFALNAAQESLSKDLNLQNIEFGRVTSAFFWAYALCQVPAGWIADRFGGRITLTICVAGWSLALMGMSWIQDLTSLIILRALLGVFQSPAYPAAGGYMKEWMPLSTRGFANGSTAMAGRSGGVVTNALTPILMALLVTYGQLTETWRYVFSIYGILGILWAVAFWWWFRDRPSEHASCNGAELELISAGRGKDKEPETLELPIIALITSPNVWLLSGVNFFSNIGWVFFATWMPKYLTDVQGLNAQVAGVLTALTAASGMAGCLIGGFVSDIAVHRLGVYVGRRIIPLTGMGVATLLYLIGLQVQEVYVLVAIFTCISFLIDFELSSRWGACQDIGGKHTATVLGFGNMCGNLAAAIFSEVTGYLTQRYPPNPETGDPGREPLWNVVFLLACIALGCTWLCWLLFDSRVPILPEDREEPK